MAINSKDKQVNSTSPNLKGTVSTLPFPLLAAARTGLIEEGRLIVTPDMARQIIARFNYKNQRSVERSHVAKLAVQMKNGVWTPGSQIAFGVMPDQVIHLVNGQHRLHAVIESGNSIEFQVLLVPAKDADELHALYYRFDTVSRPRSDRMVLRSTGIADAMGVSKDAAVAAYRAGIVISQGLKVVHGIHIDPALGTPDGKLAAIEEWWPQVKVYGDLIKEAPTTTKRRMFNQSIMAVALVTLRYQPARAAEFWSGVARDDGLTKGDPRKAMLRVIQTANLVSSLSNGLIYASHCWDAWFQGKRLDYPKVMENSTCQPLGTPFAVAKRRTA